MNNQTLLKKWLQEQKEIFYNNIIVGKDIASAVNMGKATAYNNVLLFIEELESIGDPAEEERFYAKIFPQGEDIIKEEPSVTKGFAPIKRAYLPTVTQLPKGSILKLNGIPVELLGDTPVACGTDLSKLNKGCQS